MRERERERERERKRKRERQRGKERARDLFSDVAKSGNKNVKSMLRVEKACCRMHGFVIERANGDDVGRAHLNCKLCAHL